MVDQLKREMLQISITVGFGNLETISSCYAFNQLANQSKKNYTRTRKTTTTTKVNQII